MRGTEVRGASAVGCEWWVVLAGYVLVIVVVAVVLVAQWVW